MRLTKRAMALAIAGLLAAGQAAVAQQPPQGTVPARTTAYDYDSYYAQRKSCRPRRPAAAR